MAIKISPAWIREMNDRHREKAMELAAEKARGPLPDIAVVARRNSLNWPKHWRAVIGKIQVQWDHMADQQIIRVAPLNPEYVKFVNNDHSVGLVPAMYTDVVEFASIEEVDNWARVVARIT